MNSDRSNKAPGQVKEITSLANPVIKNIRALSRKRNRDEQGVFLAEGLKLVIEARELGWHIRTLVIAKTALGNPLVEQAAAQTVAHGGLVLQVTNKVLEAISRRDNPQNTLAVIEQRISGLPREEPQPSDLWIALDRVRDPGNLGTIIRTADAVGARGVILIGDCTDPFALETVRATMGSVFAVPVVKADEEEFTSWRRSWPGQVVGTHLKGAVDFRSVDYSAGPVILLMGNEQQGLTDKLATLCDTVVIIPQAGKADSLNLAIASGIMMYEARRTYLSLRPAS